MKDYIIQRVIDVSDYFLDNKTTVRETAKNFDVSKSTIFNDLTERLIKIDKDKYEQVRKLLDENKEDRHLKGGQATKEYWAKKAN